jgi:hypothetical protein
MNWILYGWKALKGAIRGISDSETPGKVVASELKVLFEEYKDKVNKLEAKGEVSEQENIDLRLNEKELLLKIEIVSKENWRLREEVIFLKEEIKRLSDKIDELKKGKRSMYE